MQRIKTHFLICVIRQCLCDPSPLQVVLANTADHRMSLRILLVKLSKSSTKLPSSLFLNGILCFDRNSVDGGGFADIFRGTYNEQPVALKRLRVFKTDADLEKSQRVRLLLVECASNILDASFQAFCSEALVWQHLNHKSILPFLGVDLATFSPFHCMVSPWMENGNIMQCIQRLHEKQVNIPFNRWVSSHTAGYSTPINTEFA